MLTLLMIVAAFAAGALNAIAGGGSFLTFPALVFAGVPPVSANATSTVAVSPGALASAYAYRHELAGIGEIDVKSFLVVSVIGGALGALLLLATSDRAFSAIIPWLLLFATALFAAGPRLSAWIRRRARLGPRGVLVAQFLIAIYGGYFGGGIGILMLATFGIFGLTNLHAMNAMKTLLSGALNAIAVVIFIVGGAVSWPEALIMMGACVVGGYAGASVARRLPVPILRGFVIVVATAMTIYFFFA